MGKVGANGRSPLLLCGSLFPNLCVRSKKIPVRKFVRDLCLKLAEGIGIGIGKAALESLIAVGVDLVHHLF